MASPATKSASWTSLLMLLVIVTCSQVPLTLQASSKQKKGLVTHLPMPADQLTDFSLSPTSQMIAASWSLQNPSGQVASFRVEWGNNENNAEHHSCIVQYSRNMSQHHSTEQCDETPKLLSCTKYTVVVTGMDIRPQVITKRSEKNAYTMPEAPGSVTSLTNTSGTHSIALSWRRPDTLCNITGYYITYDEAVMWRKKPPLSGSAVAQEDLVNTTYNFNLTGLVPYGHYNVCVAAANQEGNSSKTCWKDLQTQQASPSSPSAFKVVSTTHNVATTWQEPLEPNGLLEHYNISWQCGDNTSYVLAYELVNTTTYTIKGLPACVKCRVWVAASTEAGEGASIESKSRTLPEAPDSVTLLPTTTAGAHSIALWWQRPDTLCNITSYYITYDGKAMWGEKNPHSGSVVMQEDLVKTIYFFNLAGLVPYAQYNVCVAAANQQGNSSLHCQEVLQTKQARPSTPSTFSVVSTADTVRASWQVPQKHNGVLGPYNISWECGAYTSYKLINTTVYTIEGLPAGVECRVRVAASTEAGEGERSEESVWIPSEGPPAHSLALPVGGAVAAVLVTAAIVGGVIMWRRGQVRKTLRQRGLSADDDYFKKLLLIVQEKSKALRNESTLITEFLALENGVQQGTTTAASSPRNIKKNRFTNILPYDAHRVQLKRSGPSSTDYINASIVQRPSDDYVTFIACQGPRDHTVEDFWWMVWEHEAKTIVMLANCVENGKNRCSPYWMVTPDMQMDNSSLTIRTTETEEGDYYTLRKITLQNGEEVKEVSQFHFTL